MSKQATAATNFCHDLSTKSGMMDFEIVIDDVIAGSAKSWMQDVFYNANGRHVETPAAELLAYMQEMERGNEDFWGLDQSEFTHFSNDTAKQWAYIEKAINEQLVSILVQVIEA